MPGEYTENIVLKEKVFVEALHKVWDRDPKDCNVKLNGTVSWTDDAASALYTGISDIYVLTSSQAAFIVNHAGAGSPQIQVNHCRIETGGADLTSLTGPCNIVSYHSMWYVSTAHKVTRLGFDDTVQTWNQFATMVYSQHDGGQPVVIEVYSDGSFGAEGTHFSDIDYIYGQVKIPTGETSAKLGIRNLRMRMFSADPHILAEGTPHSSPNYYLFNVWTHDHELITIEGANAGLVKYHPTDTRESLAVGEPLGFVDTTESTITWTDGTKVFQIAPVGDRFEFWAKGRQYLKDAAETKDISGSIAEGIWYFYYDSSGELQASQTIWTFEDHTPVALIYWDATNSKALVFSDERHGTAMPWRTHEYLHEVVGTRFHEGLGLGGNVAGDGDSESHAQVDISDGVIYDEDYKVDIQDTGGSGLFVQELSPIAELPVYYLNGSTPVWRKKTANVYPLLEGTARIKWNQYSAPNWLQTEASANGRYVAVWILATNNINEPVIVIIGQREDVLIADARENNKFESLSLPTLPLAEMKLLYRLIFQTSTTYANAPSARLRDIQDLRNITNLPAGTYVATDHGSLAGRSVENSHPAVAIRPDYSAFDKLLYDAGSDPADTVQKALDRIDDRAKNDIEIVLRRDFVPYVEIDIDTYTTLGRFTFLGTNILTVPKAAKFILWAGESGGSHYARIYDLTNANVIAEVGPFSGQTVTVQTDSTLTNLPTGEAIFEVQIRDANGKKARCSGAVLTF
jgi:hypothetical protein